MDIGIDHIVLIHPAGWTRWSDAIAHLSPELAGIMKNVIEVVWQQIVSHSMILVVSNTNLICSSVLISRI